MFDPYPRLPGKHFLCEQLCEAATQLRLAFATLFPRPEAKLAIWEFIPNESWAVADPTDPSARVEYDVPDSARTWAFFAPLYAVSPPLATLQQAITGLRPLQESLHTCRAMLLTLEQEPVSVSFDEGRFAQTIALIASSRWAHSGYWCPRHLRTLDRVAGETCRAYVCRPSLEQLDEIIEHLAQPFVFTERQRAVFEALEGRALRLNELEVKSGYTRGQLYRKGEMEELEVRGIMKLHPRLGFYRPDRPPSEILEQGQMKPK